MKIVESVREGVHVLTRIDKKTMRCKDTSREAGARTRLLVEAYEALLAAKIPVAFHKANEDGCSFDMRPIQEVLPVKVRVALGHAELPSLDVKAVIDTGASLNSLRLTAMTELATLAYRALKKKSVPVMDVMFSFGVVDGEIMITTLNVDSALAVAA